MITVFLIWVSILIVGVLFDKFIFPRLSPDNRLAKWWKENIIDYDPYDRGPR